MLRLILGKDWIRNRREILDRIAADVFQRQGGRILMVPELISHDMERRLCEAAGDTASRYAEVLSFTRLARRVAEYTQERGLDCLDNGGRVVAMAAAARSLHSKLKAYAAVETKPEFLTGLVDAVDEFKRCRITAGDLMDASRSVQGSLAQKLEELSLLLDAYDGLCAQGKRDPRDRETQLLEQLEDSDFAANHVFYIDGFPDLTRQHLAILDHLIQESPLVTVSLNCDQVGSRAMAFEKSGITAAELIRCAQRSGTEVEIQVLPAPDMPLSGLRERLFQGRIDPDPELRSRLRVLRADSLYDECAAAADRIRELVRSGCRYRDISVVCGDMAAYQDTLELVFRRCGIPLYRSGTDDILQKNIISALLGALDAALGGFDQQDVLRYLRCQLSGLAVDLCDRVENYAIQWGIRGSKWLSQWDKHPDGLGEAWTEDANNRLEELENARIKALGPLDRLCRGFRDARNLSGQVQAIYGYLDEIDLAGQLAEAAEAFDAQGDNRSAQILNQLWEILMTALEQLYDVLGATVWDAQSFTRLFALLLSQYDVGTIPPVLDAVITGPVSAMRCQAPRHLFVLGANEGSLPGYGGSAGVLTDQERVALRELGVPLTGGAMEGIQAEFSEIYGVFCGASETVTVSCCTEQPSFVYRRIEEMAGGSAPASQILGPALSDPVDAGAYLASWGAKAHAEKLGLLDQYCWIRESGSHSLGSVDPKQIRSLYGSVFQLSASQVDRQAECRLSYFLNYGLRARERKEITIDPSEFGTYVHAVLEETGRRVMELGGFHTVTLEQTMELAREYSEEYFRERFSQLDSQRVEYLFRRNGQELALVVQELWQELHASAFAPVDFETNFGRDGKLPAIPITGTTAVGALQGFVDRVDVWHELGRRYFRVVDYKTGKKDFDYCHVFNGVGLQMLLYLFALEQMGEDLLGPNPVSAGVQYFPARVPLVSADGRLTEEEAEQLRQKEWKRRGLLLADEDVLLAMEPEDAPKRLCVTRKKDGTISGDLADREQLGMLKAYIFRTLGKMVDEIASGNVEPNPYTRGASHNACTFCPYGAVCHKNHVEGRRNYKAMTAQQFWDRIGKEMETDG